MTPTYSNKPRVPTRIEDSNLLDEVHAINTCRNSDGDSYELRGGQGRTPDDMNQGGAVGWVVLFGLAFIVGCVLWGLTR